MENDWSNNVRLFGLGSMGVTLAAPFPDVIGGVLTNYTPDPIRALYVVIHPLDIDSPYGYGFVGKREGHPHFPYGFDVL